MLPDGQTSIQITSQQLISLFYSIIPFLIGGAFGLVGQWVINHYRIVDNKLRKDTIELDVTDRREERDARVQIELRSELLARVDRQEAQIEALVQKDKECTVRLVVLQQWIWVLKTALNQAGIEVEIPEELTLEDFPIPEPVFHNRGQWPPNTNASGGGGVNTGSGGRTHTMSMGNPYPDRLKVPDPSPIKKVDVKIDVGDLFKDDTSFGGNTGGGGITN